MWTPSSPDWRFRGCLFLLAFLQGSSLACIFPTLQSRMDKLGASFVTYGAAVGIYSIAGTIFSPVAGKLYSPKLMTCWQLVMVIAILSLIGNIIFLIPSIPAIIVGRFFAGIVWAANPPALAYLSTAPGQNDGTTVQKSLSRFMTSQVCGYAIGPVFSAFVSSSYSIGKFDFDVYTIAGCVITALWIVFIVVWSFQRTSEIPHAASTADSESASGTDSLKVPLMSPTDDSASPPHSLNTEPTPVHPSSPKSKAKASATLTYIHIITLALSNFVVVSSLLSSETLFAKIVEDDYGVSIQTTSLIFLGFGSGMAALMLCQPALSAKIKNDSLFLVGTEVICVLSHLLLFPYSGTTHIAIWRLVVGYASVLIFGGLAYALGYQILATLVAEAPSGGGILMGLMSTTGNFARFTSPLWVTAVYSRFGVTYDYIINSASLFTILAVLLVLYFVKQTDNKTEDEDNVTL